VPRCYHGQEQPNRAERSTPPNLPRSLCALTKTVDTHRTRLMEKLDRHTRVALTDYALRHGYLIGGPGGGSPPDEGVSG